MPVTDDPTAEQLRDEYEILSRHYFHEGNMMLKRNQFFVALNLGLFTIVGFLYGKQAGLSNVTPILLLILCSLGTIISLFWTMMTWRASWFIRSRVERMKEIEDTLKYNILRRSQLKDARWYEKPSTWLLFIILGYIFAGLWIVLFIDFLQKPGLWEIPDLATGYYLWV